MPRIEGEPATSVVSGLAFAAASVRKDGVSRKIGPRFALRVDELLRETQSEQDGPERPVAPDDIMVVTPYNAQARTLRAALPDGVRVGTFDRFQGQEAPIVFFSMATSSGEDTPRDAGFLFSRNRLSVAISRAQSLDVLVCSPTLLDARATSVEDMRLVNTLCRLAEFAAPIPG